jgi:hypothetical protein
MHYLTYELAKVIQAERLQEAEQARLANAIRPRRPSLSLKKLGARLKALGTTQKMHPRPRAGKAPV